MKNFIAATSSAEWLFSMTTVIILTVGMVLDAPIEKVAAACIIPVIAGLLHRLISEVER